MLFDSLMLRAVVSQLRDSARGARVLRVFQTSRMQAVVELSSDRPPGQLVLSCCPQFGRIHLDDGWEPDPAVSYPAGAVLRRWLRSARLVDVSQRDFDRVVRLEFANARGLGPQARCYVVLEIMGRHSNLIVLDEHNTILEAAKHIPADRNRYRQTLPGLDYVPPPDFSKQHPGDLTAQQLAATITDPQAPALAWFRATLQGASELFRDEALARAEIPADKQVSLLQAADFQRLQAALAELLQTADSARQAWTYACPDGDFAYPVSLQSRPDCRAEPASDISVAIAAIASEQMSNTELEDRRRRLLQAAERAMDRVHKRIAERQHAQQQAEDAGSVRRLGEAILASLHRIPVGATEASIPDPYEPDRTINVPLDPQLTPQANAQKYFARYKKLAALRGRIGRFLRAARRERHYLEGLVDQIQQAADAAELEVLEQEMGQQGYLRQQPTQRAGAPARIEVNSATVGGYTILWGKSGLQNDRLLHLARPTDIWLHTRKTPGGHVLIRTSDRPEQVPEEVLIAAAGHAAWLSKRRLDTAVAVDYALAKYVRRLKGTPPGYVHYTNHKTLHVTPVRVNGTRAT